jgi:hypothetical protein
VRQEESDFGARCVFKWKIRPSVELCILNGVMKLSIMTFSITTLNIKELFATFSITTLCHYDECHYAECHCAKCHVSVIVRLNVTLKFNQIYASSPNDPINLV